MTAQRAVRERGSDMKTELFLRGEYALKPTLSPTVFTSGMNSVRKGKERKMEVKFEIAGDRASVKMKMGDKESTREVEWPADVMTVGMIQQMCVLLPKTKGATYKPGATLEMGDDSPVAAYIVECLGETQTKVAGQELTCTHFRFWSSLARIVRGEVFVDAKGAIQKITTPGPQTFVLKSKK